MPSAPSNFDATQPSARMRADVQLSPLAATSPVSRRPTPDAIVTQPAPKPPKVIPPKRKRRAVLIISAVAVIIAGMNRIAWYDKRSALQCMRAV